MFKWGFMKNLFIILIMLMPALVGCTTPKTILKNNKTGQVMTCGGSVVGSLAGGVIGYHIQKSNDEECSKDYLDQGFSIISSDKSKK